MMDRYVNLDPDPALVSFEDKVLVNTNGTLLVRPRQVDDHVSFCLPVKADDWWKDPEELTEECLLVRQRLVQRLLSLAETRCSSSLGQRAEAREH